MTVAWRTYWLSPILAFFGGSFLLHLLWENLQAPLYVGFASFLQHFWMCFKASGGDILFMALLYAMMAIMHGDPLWVADRRVYRQPATWILIAGVGILLAIAFELWAVYVDHRWSYASSMPIIPVLKIGLTPVLQMMIVSTLTLWLMFRFSAER